MMNKINAVLLENSSDALITATVDHRAIVTLKGTCSSWSQLVEIGHRVAKVEGIKNVVNEITVKGLETPKKDYTPYLESGEEIGLINEVDIVIIGAGITGCGIARELSKYPLNIVVVEMSDDVATAATKANNGDIHAGHSVKPGTLKAKLNTKGNRMYNKWAEELGFDLVRCGAMGLALEESHLIALEKTYQVALANGVDGAELIDSQRAVELQPNLKTHGITPLKAIWLPSMGLVEPYEVCVALAENAADNGVEFLFNAGVGGVLVEKGAVAGVVTRKGIIKAKYVINCAGVYADEISAMAGDKSYTIHPRKGIITILDRNITPMFSAMVSLPGKANPEKNVESKGGGMCLTPEGQVLLGPSATEVPDKEDNSTDKEGYDYAMSRNFYDKIGNADVIRIFAGVRPADYMEDFVIEMSPVTHGFINVGAIQSPGLASAPAIAEMVENILLDDLRLKGEKLSEKEDFIRIRQAPIKFHKLTREEQEKIIEEDPRYAQVICRCEIITEGEIVNAIHKSIVPTSVDAIKRRVRAGMGRCQGGFCQPRIIEIMARELGKPPLEINFNSEKTNVLVKNNRSENSLKEITI